MGARNNLAAIFIQSDRYENAITHYTELLKQHPDDIEANYNIGVAYMSLGELNKAQQHYQRVLVKDTNHVDALSNLGAVYLRLKQYDKAKNVFQTALKLQPNNTTVAYMLAAITNNKKFNTSPKDYVHNLFDNYALTYDKHLTQTLHYHVPDDLDKILIDITAGETVSWQVLELGCGTGLCGKVLRKFSKHLTGIDLSDKMLAIARLKKTYDKLIGEDFIVYFQADNKHYDLIVAADVLVYFGDLRAVFQACKAHLAPQGLFIFSVEKTDKPDFKLQDTARFAHAQHYINNLAKKVGLTVIACHELIGRIQDNEPLYMNMFVLHRI